MERLIYDGQTLNEAGLVGSLLRGDRFYGKVFNSARAILTVRSEIGLEIFVSHSK